MNQPTSETPQATSTARRHPVMTVLFIVLGVLFVILVAVAGLVAMQPDEFTLSRSLKMSAPPEEVFAQVNDFRNWDAWSPWAKLDPNSEVRYEGPPAGEGAQFYWDGNSDVGEGDMEIVESRPAELIRVRLHFVRPMEDTAEAQFAFVPQGDETEVTWSMHGKNNFVGKVFFLVMDMDAMVGGQFEQGLASMKQVVESQPTDN